MDAPRNYNHVRLEPGETLACLHCGSRYKIAMPAPIGMFVKILSAWNEEHKDCPPSPSAEAKERERWERQFKDEDSWILGTDRGVSSETIFYAMRGRPRPGGVLAPQDPDDFGRCLRLVEAFGWRARLPEVVQFCPAWERIVARWDEFAAMMREEIPGYADFKTTGSAPRLYALMRGRAPEKEQP